MIHVDFNNIKDEIDDFIGQDQGDHGNGDSSKCLKFISFFFNNRSGHSEQLTTTIEMIQVNLDDTKADDTMTTPFEKKMKYNLREKVKKVKRK